MWARMLAVPGSARITSLEVVPVAVDVQVRRSPSDSASQTRGRVRTGFRLAQLSSVIIPDPPAVPSVGNY
jgi:hypothetical protein